MIGQKRIKSELSEFISNPFKTTAIICGDVGSGKKTLIREALKNYQGLSYIVDDVKKETITELINQMYKTAYPTIYVIPDIDNMSIAAMNSLLKITEEPPNNAKLILTCSDTEVILPTIYSRALKYYMEQYTSDEIKQYISQYYELTSPQEEKDICLMVCSNPGEVDLLMGMQPMEFYDYVELVFENIGKVSGTNALKIGNRIAFKEDSDGFDLRLFFILFEKLCLDAYVETGDFNYNLWLKLTSKAIQDLKVKGINKSALFDVWVLDVRRVIL